MKQIRIRASSAVRRVRRITVGRRGIRCLQPARQPVINRECLFVVVAHTILMDACLVAGLLQVQTGVVCLRVVETPHIPSNDTRNETTQPSFALPNDLPASGAVNSASVV